MRTDSEMEASGAVEGPTVGAACCCTVSRAFLQDLHLRVDSERGNCFHFFNMAWAPKMKDAFRQRGGAEGFRQGPQKRPPATSWNQGRGRWDVAPRKGAV